MAGAVPTLFRFTRWDERIGTMPVLGELVHTEELNGEDTIEFSSRETPDKGDRLLWLDGDVWREHVVVRTEEPMAGICNVYAESSLCEMLDDFIEEAQLVNRTALQALTAVLAPTRWSIAHCDSLGTADPLVHRALRFARHRRGAYLPPERALGLAARGRGLEGRDNAGHRRIRRARCIAERSA